MDAQFETAPRFVGDGIEETPWMGAGCSVVTQDVFGRFGEAARRGYVYSAGSAPAGAAIVAANVSPLAASTGQPIVGVWNPPGSGVTVHVLRVKVWVVSATPGAAPVAVWNIIPASSITAGGVQAVNHKTGTISSLARAYVNAATTGSAAGVYIRPVGPQLFAAALSATLPGPFFIEEFPDGDIVAPPGVAIAIAAGAAGTSPVVGATITWAEVPGTL